MTLGSSEEAQSNTDACQSRKEVSFWSFGISLLYSQKEYHLGSSLIDRKMESQIIEVNCTRQITHWVTEQKSHLLYPSLLLFLVLAHLQRICYPTYHWLWWWEVQLMDEGQPWWSTNPVATLFSHLQLHRLICSWVGLDGIGGAVSCRPGTQRINSGLLVLVTWVSRAMLQPLVRRKGRQRSEFKASLGFSFLLRCRKSSKNIASSLTKKKKLGDL